MENKFYKVKKPTQKNTKIEACYDRDSFNFQNRYENDPNIKMDKAQGHKFKNVKQQYNVTKGGKKSKESMKTFMMKNQKIVNK